MLGILTRDFNVVDITAVVAVRRTKDQIGVWWSFYVGILWRVGILKSRSSEGESRRSWSAGVASIDDEKRGWWTVVTESEILVRGPPAWGNCCLELPAGGGASGRGTASAPVPEVVGSSRRSGDSSWERREQSELVVDWWCTCAWS